MLVLKRIAIALGVILLVAIAAITWILGDRPDLSPLEARELPPAEGAEGVTVTFLGVSTLLFRDSETALMTDGFFSRPALLPVVLSRPIEPDLERIASGLERAGVDRLAAVMAVHSHYDHAMDSPEVARRTGAIVLGSRSTANVARGWGLPEAQIREVVSGEPMRFGAFTVTFVTSRHFPLPPPASRTLGVEITEPLVPPAPWTAWSEGGSYSIFIEHPRGTALVQGSAGFVEGALEGRSADVVFLGLGGLGAKELAYTEAYWHHVVAAVGAGRVIPIHWDDFTLPLERDLVAFPRMLSDLEQTLDFLVERAEDPSIELRALPPLEPVVLFQAMAAEG